jgi:hypothetical protein
MHNLRQLALPAHERRSGDFSPPASKISRASRSPSDIDSVPFKRTAPVRPPKGGARPSGGPRLNNCTRFSHHYPMRRAIGTRNNLASFLFFCARFCRNRTTHQIEECWAISRLPKLPPDFGWHFPSSRPTFCSPNAGQSSPSSWLTSAWQRALQTPDSVNSAAMEISAVRWRIWPPSS